MNRMGGSCSMQQRQQNDHGGRERHLFGVPRNGQGGQSDLSTRQHRSLRHSVVDAVPDGSIASLYPVEDNYIFESNRTRSPKCLTELCVDTLCRNLPFLNGELPPGLPQDVVDDIVLSLMRHSALNQNTLSALRRCELGVLSLAACRGVTDEWLEPLGKGSCTAVSLSMETLPVVPSIPMSSSVQTSMEIDDVLNGNNLPTTTISYSVQQVLPFQLDDIDRINRGMVRESPGDNMEDSSSSCSTSSFLSASSSPRNPEMVSPPWINEKLGRTKNFSVLDLLDPNEVSSRGGEATIYHSDHLLVDDSSLPMSSLSSISNLTLLDLRGCQRLSDEGLLHLVDLRKVEMAKLDNCHSIAGRGLLAFANSKSLRALSLAHCRRLTDDGVVNVSHLVSIESLSLDGCRCLTDRSLAALGDLYRLRRLDLSQCDLITDDGLANLSKLESLEELFLGWCRSISDHGLNIVTAQSGRSLRLRSLRLARCSVTDEGIKHLGRLSALKHLDLNGCCNVGSTAMGECLRRLQHLETLDVSYCPGILRTSWQGCCMHLKTLILAYSGVKDSHLSQWINLPSLAELSFDSCPVGDWAIAHLTENNVVPNLTSLDLADTDLTDIGMASLPKFNKLTHLSLFYCNITNNGLRHLSQMSKLEVLNIDSREISDEGLSHLRNLTRLKRLDIFSGRITDSGCAHVAKILTLESLELCGGGVGDLGCNLLASLENLTNLNLSQNDRITNRGAAALATLSKLKSLNLSSTRVSPAALRFFGGLKNLQSLTLYGCRGIDDRVEVNRFLGSLPSLKCFRLNGSAEDDGTIIWDENDEINFDGRFDSHAPSIHESAHNYNFYLHQSEGEDEDDASADQD